MPVSLSCGVQVEPERAKTHTEPLPSASPLTSAVSPSPESATASTETAIGHSLAGRGQLFVLAPARASAREDPCGAAGMFAVAADQRGVAVGESATLRAKVATDLPGWR